MIIPGIAAFVAKANWYDAGELGGVFLAVSRILTAPLHVLERFRKEKSARLAKTLKWLQVSYSRAHQSDPHPTHTVTRSLEPCQSQSDHMLSSSELQNLPRSLPR